VAKIKSPYTCDVCGIEKQPSNNWLLGVFGRLTSVVVSIKSVAMSGVVIMPWHPEVADAEGVQHLCGVECAQKFTGREVMKLTGKEVTPDAQV
jgi:hypothetical protein